MKKIFTLLVFMTSLAVSAQSIRLFYDGQALNDQDTININAVIGGFNNTYIEYANISNDDIYFIILKEELQMVDDATVTFCIGNQCYSLDTSQKIFLSQSDTVTTADSARLFHSTYTTSSNGISIIKYSFFNAENPEDITSVILRYTTGTGIYNPSAKDIALRAYPNPATTSVNITFNGSNVQNAYLVIKNLAGIEIYRSSLPSDGKIHVRTSDFHSGIYLYGIEVNGTMLNTKKLLIK